MATKTYSQIGEGGGSITKQEHQAVSLGYEQSEKLLGLWSVGDPAVRDAPEVELTK